MYNERKKRGERERGGSRTYMMKVFLSLSFSLFFSSVGFQSIRQSEKLKFQSVMRREGKSRSAESKYNRSGNL